MALFLICAHIVSHPTRVRGLKLKDDKEFEATITSHPTRVRGLKLFTLPLKPKWNVAPHTGAWIETSTSLAAAFSSMSHPTRVRGLKLFHHPAPQPFAPVAPHTGAWIETKLAFYHERIF